MKQTRLFTGGMDLDSAPEHIKKGDYRKIINGVVSRPNSGKRGFVHNYKSFSKLTQSLTDTGDVCIGGFEVLDGNTKFVFYYNPSGTKNKIIKFEDGVATKVAQSGMLGFQANDEISSGAFVDSVLYYTDGRSDLKALNLNNNMVFTGVTPDEILARDITLIKPPPQTAPSVERSTTGEGGATVDSNLIADRDFQVAIQYVYDTGQKSVLGTYSRMSHRDYNSENNKALLITLNTKNDPLPKYVQEVNICVREGSIGVWRIVETLKVSEISYNSDGNIEYYFLNTKQGPVLADRYTNNFDAVPLKANTLEISNNRLWPGGITEGYDTPGDIIGTFDLSYTALGANVYDELQPVKLVEKEYVVEWNEDETALEETLVSTTPLSGYYVAADPSKPNTYTSVTGYNPTLPVAAGATDTTLYSLGATEKIVSSYIGNGNPVIVEIDTTYQLHDVIRIDRGFASSLDLAGEHSLIPNSTYQAGIVFHDFAGRSSGVFTKDEWVVTTPRDLDKFKIQLNWDLTGDNRNNIPSWAVSYSIVLTKNLTNSFFLETQSTNCFFSRVSADGVKTRHYGGVAKLVQFIEFDVAGMINNGFGYEYQEGDRLVAYDLFGGGNDYDLEILGVDGTSIVCKQYASYFPVAISSLQTHRIVIYRPRKSNDDQIFYEIGHRYGIMRNNIAAWFETPKGSYEGDSILVKRDAHTLSSYDLTTGVATLNAIATKDIFRQANAPSSETDDEGWFWNTDHGRAFIVLKEGQKEKTNYGRYSNSFISDTESNALNEFEPTSEFFTPIEDGEILAIKKTGKAQGDGSVLLAVCENNASTIYVGEVPLHIEQDTSFMVQSSRVVGGVKASPDRFGTLHPLSVYEHNGVVYWFDYKNKAFVAHINGRTSPISEEGVRTFFRDKAAEMSNTDPVITGFDHEYGLIYVSFQNASEDKTISWSVDDKRWTGIHTFAPDLFVESRDKFTLIDGIDIIQRAASGYALLDGAGMHLNIQMVFNDDLSFDKWWRAIILELNESLILWANGEPYLDDTADINITITNANGQETNIQIHEFDVASGKVYGGIMCDINSTGGLLDGDDIVSPYIEVEIKIEHASAAYLKMIHSEALESRY